VGARGFEGAAIVQDLEGLDQVDDPATQGNRFPAQTIGIALPIPALMMVADDAQHIEGEPEVLQEGGGQNRVRLDARHFLTRKPRLGEKPWIQEEGAHIVEDGSDADGFQLRRLEFQVQGEPAGQLGGF